MAIKSPSVYSFVFLLDTDQKCVLEWGITFFPQHHAFFFAPLATIDDLKNLRLPKLYIASYICNISPVKTDKEFINTTVHSKRDNNIKQTFKLSIISRENVLTGYRYLICHCCREQHSLSSPWTELNNLFHLVLEVLVQHSKNLVKVHISMLDCESTQQYHTM